MSDPMDRLSGADPELGRAVPPTPVFAATEGTPLFAGPLKAVLIAAAVVLVIGIPAWLLGGDGGDVVAPATSTSTAEEPSTTTVPETTSTTEPESTTTTMGAPDWEGEPFDFWVPVPEEGSILGVVGVRYDDTLNVRSGPGVGFEVLGELDPLTQGFAGTGAGWQLPDGDVWWEIEAPGGLVGWVNQRYVSRFGPAFDRTSEVLAAGPIPPQESMEDLVELVADRLGASPDQRVLVAAPTPGDLFEIKMDLLGFRDDSVGGARLYVFGQSEDGGQTFGLKSVEEIVFCQRGVSGDLCV